MVTKPVNYGKKKPRLKINNDLYRLGKYDDLNWVIELKVKPKKQESQEKWNIISYYANLEDMVWGLIKLTAGIPKHEDLVEQVKLLIEELKRVEKTIVDQLKETLEVENV